jgi:hypothetical protein
MNRLKWCFSVMSVLTLLSLSMLSLQGCGEFKCEKDADCASNATFADKGLKYCSTSRGVCVACTTNDHCGDGKVCSADSQTCADKKEEKPTEVTEPATKIKFLSSIKPHGGAPDQFLLGLGARVKVIITVYALGFYLEPKPAADALKGFKGKKAADLEKDKTFYEALLKGEFGKSMRLVMAIDLDNETLNSAFDDSLEPRLKTEDGKKALETFKGYFKELLKEGDDIVFTWADKGTTLHVSIKGKHVGTIKNADFANALLASYLDDDPASPGAKKAFAAGLELLFQKAAQ